MRIIFMGTPVLAVPALEALHGEHEVVLVVTQPDKPARRGHTLQSSPVKERAQELGIPVAQPAKARDAAFVEELRTYRPEAIAVVAYGQILPRAMLELPREHHPHGGCVNLHFSLLPRWRGAAPVQYAIWHGDRVTGITTQWMAEKLDAGDIILQREVAIGAEETSAELFERLTPLGADMLRDTLRLMESGAAPRVPQDESAATLAPTIKKEQGRINWSDTAIHIANQVRALNPWPVAWCEWNGEPLRIWRAGDAEAKEADSAAPGTILSVSEEVLVAAGENVVQLREVQAPGRPRMAAADWARGARLEAGQRLM